MSDPAIGTLSQLGSYYLLRLVEEKPYYAAYESTHPASGAPVLVTVFSPRFAGVEGFHERFAEAMSRLQRADGLHLARSHGGGVDEMVGAPYAVEEFFGGASLADELAANQPIDPAVVATRVSQAAEGLKALQKAGVPHRDIRPGSLRLGRDGSVKVANLGRAGLLPPNMFRLDHDLFVGSPLYLAPETARGQGADHRSDLYSLAAVAYHMFAGRAPFLGESIDEILRQHVAATPPELATLVEGVPEGLWEIVRDTLAKDPSQRYADYDTFLIDWNATIRASGLAGAAAAPGAAPALARSASMSGRPGASSTGHKAMSSSSYMGQGPDGFEDPDRQIDLPPPDKVGMKGDAKRQSFDDLAAIMPGMASSKLRMKDDAPGMAVQRTANIDDFEPNKNPLLKAIVWLGVLAALGGGGYAGYLKLQSNLANGDGGGGSDEAYARAIARWDQTGTLVTKIGSQVALYEGRNGKAPTIDELVAEGVFTLDELKDPYGTVLRIDRHSKVVASDGADRIKGTADDFLFNWETTRMAQRPPKPDRGKVEEEEEYSTLQKDK